MELIKEQNRETLEKKIAEEIVNISKKSIEQSGQFNMAVSGGSSPLGVYRLLATEFRECMDWKNVSIFWVDDRYVPFDAPESNFGQFIKMFDERVLSQVKLFPMYQDKMDYKSAASFYESKIMAHFKSSIPKFDLVILGVGTDGHTASLFPNAPILSEITRLVKDVEAPDYAPIKERVSFTYSLINDAKLIITLLTGEAKKDVFASFQNSKHQYPIEFIKKEKMILCTDLA